MRSLPISISTVLCASFLAGTLSQVGSAHELKSRQSTSGILINPPGFPPLPSEQQAVGVASRAGLNLTNIQGDVLIGMRKKKELFFFFGINSNSVATFKSKLASDIHPLITSTTQLLDVSTQSVTALNIAFSQSGLSLLGINGTNPLNDAFFEKGQAADATSLGDPGTSNWIPGFINTKSLHGVLLLASDTVDKINAELARIQSIFGNSIVELHRLQGEARPGDEEGHEHFGFLDGISQPAVDGFTSAGSHQASIPAGKVILGEASDTRARPEWAKDGSFLVFRQLKQNVPEFDKFLTDNPIRISPLNVTQGSALMGARMVGRWKSGAPLDLAPLVDDPALGADPDRNNAFDFLLAGDQSRCPFSAHIRKTNPRTDFNPNDPKSFNSFPDNHIIRAGIPYGPEVTRAEAASNTTTIERGLAFVAYQSNIDNGFRRHQVDWANNEAFFDHVRDPGAPGYDPIIGANGGKPRNVVGLDATNEKRTITLFKDFVESRGGEYFFSPSLSAILSTLAV